MNCQLSTIRLYPSRRLSLLSCQLKPPPKKHSWFDGCLKLQRTHSHIQKLQIHRPHLGQMQAFGMPEALVQMRLPQHRVRLGLQALLLAEEFPDVDDGNLGCQLAHVNGLQLVAQASKKVMVSAMGKPTILAFPAVPFFLPKYLSNTWEQMGRRSLPLFSNKCRAASGEVIWIYRSVNRC